MAPRTVLAFLFFAASAVAQTCSNYGVSRDGGCQCPSGLGGADCSQVVCGNPLVNQTDRPALAPATAGNSGSAGCGAQCTSGFDGVSCNVCQSTSACQAVLSSIEQANAGLPTSSASLGGSASSSVICSQDSTAYGVNFGQCDVINPTLQAVFPGSTYLLLERSADPSASSLSSQTVSALSAGTAFAQLFYAANTSSPVVEQFACAGSNCTQTLEDGQLRYDCGAIQCHCNPGTTFCGGGFLDLSSTINGLSGGLSIDCDVGNSTSSSSGSKCYFKQSLLQNLFGPDGLALSSCNFGECVQQSVVNTKKAQLTGESESHPLSGGVIAGLAVLGGIIFVLLVLLLLGCLQQRKARRGGGAFGAAGQWKGGAGVVWTDIRYVLLPRNRTLAFVEDMTEGMKKEKAGTPTNEMEKGHESRILPTFKSEATSRKVLLDGLSGRVEPGTMMAILGPSGAGKSTLIDILSGQRKAGKISGTRQIALPGSPTSSVSIAFVDQSDVLPATSTVREALLFAARLKLPESVSLRDKAARVEEVLGLLGLKEVAGTRIGNEERRGISGGERRRLSIGIELLARPSVLFLDEPTSGLDSVSAMRVVRVLRDLSRQSTSGEPGTTVIASIHQPSSQIFHSFDTICVLALGGRQVYGGPTEAAVDHFAAKGLTCPSGYNPADYLLEIASDAPPNAFTTAHALGSSDSLKPRLTPSPSFNNASSTSQVPPPSPSTPTSAAGPGPKRKRTRPVTTALTQFEVLAGREWKTLVRDPTLFWMHAAVAICLGLFIGGLYWQVKETIAGFQNRVGSLFFLGSVVAFSALSALNNLTHMRVLFMRERAAAMYSPWVWLLSRVVFDVVPLRIVPTIIMSTIVYWMVGLTAQAANFFKFLLIIVELNIALVLFNFLLASLLRNAGSAILLSSIIGLAQMAYAGFFTNLRSIPPVLRWIQWLAPLKYALEALTVNEISNGLLIKDSLSGVNIQVSASLIMDLLFGFQKDAYYRDVLVLFGWIGFFLCALVVTVFYRLREVR